MNSRSRVLSSYVFVLASMSAAGCSSNATDGAKDVPRRPGAADAGVLSGSGDLSAIGDTGSGSVSIVRFATSQSTDKALILGAGHSVGILASGTQPPPGSASVAQPTNFSFFLADSAKLVPFQPGVTNPRAAGDVRATLPIVELLYATLTGTDLALYRLDMTYAELERTYGVKPLVLSQHPAAAGVAIRIASGLFHAIFSCSIDAVVHELREGRWTWQDSARYRQPGCEVVGGTSGAPVIDAVTMEVIAINNTVNESGQQCTDDNPCEVDPGGNITATLGAAYGQQVFRLYACLSDTNDIELDRPGCQLTKPATAASIAR